jgi:short-subunit dehydrogenase
MKTVVITGGSEGLGKAIAKRLSPNHNVTILARTQETLAAAADEIGCSYKVCDVRDYSQIEAVMQEIGTVDCLINNAGIWLQGDLDTTDPDRIEEVLQVNTLGTINCTKAVMPVMKQQRSGRIINVISQAGLNARAGWPVYIASKWAVTGFTKSMQQELEPFGIGVTGFYPATINTELFNKSGAPKDTSKDLDPDETARAIEYIVNCDNSILIPEMGIKQNKA